jgi:hypothetical protein
VVIEKVFQNDPRTLLEIRALKEIHLQPGEALVIADCRLRYLAKASILGWKAVEDPPLLTQIAQLTSIELEAYQRAKMAKLQPPHFPAAFRSDKPLTQSIQQFPTVDRMGKPIRNPQAYLQAIVRNQQK